MKKRVIVIPVIVLLLAGAAFLIWRSVGGSSSPTVVLDQVIPADLTKEVIATGDIASEESATVVTGTSGRISRVLVEEGDSVRVGSVLAVLEDTSIRRREQSALLTLEATGQQIRRELLSLRSAYADAEVALQQAQASYDRTSELQSIGSATREALRQAQEAVTAAQRALDRAREQLNFREGRSIDDPRTTPAQTDDEIIAGSIEIRQAEANLESIRSELDDTRITARRAGTVTEVYVEPGDLVGSGTEVARLDRMTDLVVQSAVDEVDLGDLELGQPVRVESDSFIGTTLEGTVSRIGQIIHRQGEQRVCSIEVSFNDPDHVARVGASCAIYITVREAPDAPSIPIESFFLDNGGKYVYVAVPQSEGEAEEGMSLYTLEKREVQIGIIGLGRAEVLSGLEMGETIVAAGVRELTVGQVVQAAEPASPDPNTDPDATEAATTDGDVSGETTTDD